jgi:hypothetical protein
MMATDFRWSGFGPTPFELYRKRLEAGEKPDEALANAMQELQSLAPDYQRFVDAGISPGAYQSHPTATAVMELLTRPIRAAMGSVPGQVAEQASARYTGLSPTQQLANPVADKAADIIALGANLLPWAAASSMTRGLPPALANTAVQRVATPLTGMARGALATGLQAAAQGRTPGAAELAQNAAFGAGADMGAAALRGLAAARNIVPATTAGKLGMSAAESLAAGAGATAAGAPVAVATGQSLGDYLKSMVMDTATDLGVDMAAAALFHTRLSKSNLRMDEGTAQRVRRPLEALAKAQQLAAEGQSTDGLRRQYEAHTRALDASPEAQAEFRQAWEEAIITFQPTNTISARAIQKRLNVDAPMSERVIQTLADAQVIKPTQVGKQTAWTFTDAPMSRSARDGYLLDVVNRLGRGEVVTPEGVQRKLGAAPVEAQAAIDSLTREGFLRPAEGGEYHWQTGKADVPGPPPGQRETRLLEFAQRLRDKERVTLDDVQRLGMGYREAKQIVADLQKEGFLRPDKGAYRWNRQMAWPSDTMMQARQAAETGLPAVVSTAQRKYLGDVERTGNQVDLAVLSQLDEARRQAIQTRHEGTATLGPEVRRELANVRREQGRAINELVPEEFRRVEVPGRGAVEIKRQGDIERARQTLLDEELSNMASELQGHTFDRGDVYRDPETGQALGTGHYGNVSTKPQWARDLNETPETLARAIERGQGVVYDRLREIARERLESGVRPPEWDGDGLPEKWQMLATMDQPEFTTSRPTLAERIEPIVKAAGEVPPDDQQQAPLSFASVQAELRPDIEALEARKEVAAERGSVILPGKAVQPSEYAFPKAQEQRYQAARSIQEAGAIQKIRNGIEATKQGFTRVYQHLPRTAENAPLMHNLLNLEKQRGVAADYTVNALRGITAGLDKNTTDLFERKVLLDDLAESANKGEALPFGFTPESLTEHHGKVTQAADATPAVQQALAKRKRVWDALKGEYTRVMGEAGFDVGDRFTRENYFRHLVLEHMQDGYQTPGGGRKLRTPTYEGFLKKREGSTKDIAANYLQAEYEVMAKMLYDMERAKSIKFVDDKYNIAPKLKEQAAKQEVDWHTLIPDGYTTWQPREGNVFYMTDTIPAKMAQALELGAVEELGITKEDLGRALSVGGKRREFAVKQEVADTLDELFKPRPTGALGAIGRTVNRGWKRMVLTHPRKVVKYNLRNLSGDAEAVFVGNPSAFAKAPRATKELYQAFKRKTMSADMQDWFQRGGMESLLQVQELNEIDKLSVFNHIRDDNTGVFKKVWNGIWNTTRGMTDFREAILRYSAYLDYLEQMKRNGGAPDNFGASIREEVMALDDIKDRAFKLSNELLGAYDEVSPIGKELREKLIPFWSFLEVNAKRYVQFAKNAVIDGKTAQKAGQKLLGAAAFRAPYTAYRVGKFALKAAGLATMLEVWNRSMFPEEEERLQNKLDGKLHVIYGIDKNGEPLYTDRLGMLQDFLEWFGLDAAPRDVMDLLNGKRTLVEVAKDMALSPVEKVYGSLLPLPKAVIEGWVGVKSFPKPTMIRDKAEYVAQQFSLENEYRALMGKPSRGYGRSWADAFVSRADLGESDYYTALDLKRKWEKEKQGKYSSTVINTSPKSDALYNYKAALRYGDKEAARRYLAKYVAAGGNDRGYAQSMKTLHPLYGLDEKEQPQFLASLSQSDREIVQRAIEYYDELMETEKSVDKAGMPVTQRKTLRKAPSYKAPTLRMPKPKLGY